MPAVVSPRPVQLADGATTTGVVIAQAVSPREWGAISNAYNTVDGMGSSLIPTCAPNQSINAGSSLTMNFRVWPRYQATHRMWIFSLGVISGTAGFTFTDPSGGTRTGTVSSSYGRQLTHVETITVRTSDETKLSVSVAITTTNTTIYGIGCIELPRGVLAVGGSAQATADCGEESRFIRTGLPITDDYAGLGIGFIARELAGLRDNARRTGQFAGAPFATSSSSTFANVFQAQPIALGRSIFNGSTTRKLQLAAYVRADTTALGEVRWTLASGPTVTAVIPMGAADGTLLRTELDADCEDLTASDGRRATRNETVTVELRRSAGSGTVYLDTVSGGESVPGATSSATANQGIRLGRRPPPRFMVGAGQRRRR